MFSSPISYVAYSIICSRRPVGVLQTPVWECRLAAVCPVIYYMVCAAAEDRTPCNKLNPTEDHLASTMPGPHNIQAANMIAQQSSFYQ